MIQESWKEKFVRIHTDNGAVSFDGILEDFDEYGLQISTLSEPERHIYITTRSLCRVELLGDNATMEANLEHEHKKGLAGNTIGIFFMSIGMLGVSYAIASSVRLGVHEYFLFLIGLASVYAITSVPVWLITESRLRSKIISLHTGQLCLLLLP